MPHFRIITLCPFFCDNHKHLAPQTESPRFKKFLAAARSAPPSYKPPDQKRIGGDLLESTTLRLRADEKPLRDAATADGCTVVSDGWDDVERNHLINFLVVTQKGAFFDGTVKLTSTDSENATAVAKLLADDPPPYAAAPRPPRVPRCTESTARHPPL